jgi:hypothetical protein
VTDAQVARRFRLALDKYESGERIARSALRRRYPHASLMTQLKRRPVLIVAVVLLLAACGGTTSSVTHPVTGLVKGEFVGDAGRLGGIGLSTNGRQVIAYLCNGTDRHVSVAQWFTGPVTSNNIGITNPRGAHLTAAVSVRAITGTVTLANGRSAPFTAHLLPDPGSDYGLVRSEQTFHGVRYLGGWIFAPPEFASARVGTGPEASLTSATVPMPVCCLPREGGTAIINEQTGALIISPPVENAVSVTVLGLGTFRLTPCRKAQC